MKETIEAIFDLIAEALGEGDDTVVGSDGIHAELRTGDDFLSLRVTVGEPLGKGVSEKDGERLRKRAQCKALRKEFYSYVKGLDKEIFDKACGALAPDRLARLNGIIRREDEDVERLRKAMDAFKASVNDVIMSEIVRLKSLMVSVSGRG